ncbi:hypothetical protein APHAL10511_007766 [Amanita phalloides]|nr:hypothetical protein APHAL10511_007766 [Amanita phalloides]
MSMRSFCVKYWVWSMHNAQVRNLIQDQWRDEHARELDPEINDIDIDDMNPDDWQRLDDAIAQALAVPVNEQQQQQEGDIYGENRRFENQIRRDMQNQQNDIPEDPPRDPKNLPRGRRPYIDLQPNEIHGLGPMNVICSHCNALHWDFEKLPASTARNPKFGSCCLQGQIQLPALREPPRFLRDLLCGISPHSKAFRKDICQYNAAFVFTSLGVKIDHAVTNAPGPYSFCNHGELHHHSGALHPEENQPEWYAQIYIHDSADMQVNMRMANNPQLHAAIMTELQAMVL